MGGVARPFFPDVACGIEDALAPVGSSLILSSDRRDPTRERVNSARRARSRAATGPGSAGWRYGPGRPAPPNRPSGSS